MNLECVNDATTTEKLEDETRIEIDVKLEAAGWLVQDKNRMNLFAAPAVAVHEMDTDTGPADYMLFVDGKTSAIKSVGKPLDRASRKDQRVCQKYTEHVWSMFNVVSKNAVNIVHSYVFLKDW